MLMHFDILYIGQDDNLWKQLTHIAEDYDFSILNIRHSKDIDLIKEDFSFTIVLSELHLDYNYEGFTIDKLGLKYTFIGILTNELDEKQVLVSEYLFSPQEKYLILKDNHSVYSFLISKPIHYSTSQQPIEA